VVGVQRRECRGQGRQHAIDHLTEGPQGMRRGDALLERYIAEHPRLLFVTAAHRTLDEETRHDSIGCAILNQSFFRSLLACLETMRQQARSRTNVACDKRCVATVTRVS
jgi:hypothetical protein